MSELQFVVFRLGTEEYGIDISNVREIVHVQEITKLPNTNGLIEGILNLRGNIIPIVDLNKRYYGTKTETDENSRIIVVNGGNQVLGIITNEVAEVLNISSEMIEPAPALISRITKRAGIKGVGKLEQRLVIIIDLKEAFSLEEFDQMQEAVS